jgi:hypothetical protein
LDRADVLVRGGVVTYLDQSAEIDALDREYYKAKLEELGYCLPVVRAAKAYLENTDSSCDSELVHRLAVAVQSWVERPKP